MPIDKEVYTLLGGGKVQILLDHGYTVISQEELECLQAEAQGCVCAGGCDGDILRLPEQRGSWAEHAEE